MPYLNVLGIRSRSYGCPQIVMNMCDGTEEDGYPGISVVNQLEARDIMYTGSGPSFYHITTSKLDIKNRLIAGTLASCCYPPERIC